jgi:hypothetical protein
LTKTITHLPIDDVLYQSSLQELQFVSKERFRLERVYIEEQLKENPEMLNENEFESRRERITL